MLRVGRGAPRGSWPPDTAARVRIGIRTRPRTCATGARRVPAAPPISRGHLRRPRLRASRDARGELALGRSPDGRQRPFLEVPLGLEALLLDDAAVVQDQERALVDLAPAEGDAGVVLDDLQGEPGGGEERRVLSLADPEQGGPRRGRSKRGRPGARRCRRQPSSRAAAQAPWAGCPSALRARRSPRNRRSSSERRARSRAPRRSPRRCE